MHLAQANSSDGRIVITDPDCARVRPGVDMDMLKFDVAPCESRGDEGVVDLLGVLIEDVAVPLVFRDFGGFIDAGEKAGQRRVR